MALVQLLLEYAVLPHELPVGQGPLDQQRQAVHVHGLGQVVVGTFLHGLHSVLDGPMSGEDDHRQTRVLRARPPQQLLSGELRHLQIGDDQVDVPAAKQLRRSLAVRSEGNLVAVELQHLAQALTDVLLVIHDEDVVVHRLSSRYPIRRFSFWGMGKLKVKLAPLPTLESTAISPRCSFTIL